MNVLKRSSTVTPRPLVVALTLAMMACPPLLCAGTLPVTSCADDGSVGTLRQVIATAATGDTVDLGALVCSQVTLIAGVIPISVDALAIDGGSTAITISGSDADRVFSHTGYGILRLSGLTVAHGRNEGYSSLGGCIASYGSVELDNATVTACAIHSTGYDGTAAGGGLYATYGVTLTDSTVSGNSVVADGTGPFALATGGGFSTYNANLHLASVVAGNTISAASSACGGGIYAYRAILDSTYVTSNVVSNGTSVNARYANGGGICASSTTLFTSNVTHNSVSAGANYYVAGGGIRSGDLTTHASTISGNRATSGAMAYGGGISTSGDLSLAYSVVDNNESSGAGGGVSGYSIFVDDSTVSSNRADAGLGGGLYGSALTLSSSTIAFNYAGEGAGGAFLFTTSDTQTLYNVIVANDTIGANAAHAADIGALGTPTFAGANNLVMDIDASLTLPADTLDADPELLPLGDYGGAIRTHALAQTSPAIDAGNNHANLRNDQRGETYARVVGVAADIGAFEIQGPLDGDSIFNDGFES